MLAVDENDDAGAVFQLRLVLAPDRSSDWQQNKKVIFILGAVCLSIALGFFFILGVWIVLPFAGLEIALLSAALYYVSWKLSYRHILTFDSENLRIDKGVYQPRGTWIWAKRDTQLEIETAKHDWQADKLTLVHGDERLNIGDFLGKDDAKAVVALLRGQILCKIRRSP